MAGGTGLTRRPEWVKSLLARKTAPKGWQYFTVHAITHHPETASGYDGKVAAEMNGAETGEDTDRWGWNPLRKFAWSRGPRGTSNGDVPLP